MDDDSVSPWCHCPDSLYQKDFEENIAFSLTNRKDWQKFVSWVGDFSWNKAESFRKNKRKCGLPLYAKF